MSGISPTTVPVLNHDQDQNYPYKILYIYLVLVLPLATLLLSPDIAGGRGDLHKFHPLIYWIASTLSLGALMFATHRRASKIPRSPFFWKVVAALGATILLIICNVILPVMVEQVTPDIYTSYLIGRLCFLVAMSMLFCVGPSYQALDKVYDEALYQMRMGWSAFAILFASDPILTNYLHSSMSGSPQIPGHIILTLVHLNFCGGVTLVILPLWKLHELRARSVEKQIGHPTDEVADDPGIDSVISPAPQ